MKILQVAIVDDEPLAIELLESYILQLPEINIVGKCLNAVDAFKLLNNNDIDVVFLDINMPDISGLQLLKTLKDPPKVIFTTAYLEYGAVSYEYNAIDYLLKPISFERFMLAINKVMSAMHDTTELTTTSSEEEKLEIMFVKTDNKLTKIDLSKILYIEALKDYVKLCMMDKKIIIHSSMKKIEVNLEPFSWFIRVHKSYIVNMKFVSEIDGNCIRVGGQTIPIGVTHKETVLRLFNKYRFI